VEAERLLSYDPETNALRWKMNRPPYGKIGNIATIRNARGYLKVRLGGRHEFAHRVAWALFYGRIPEKSLDHINGVRDDNRISNLREATCAQNLRNVRKHRDNSSNYKGVSWSSKSQKWRSVIFVNGKQKHLGLYNNAEDAHKQYMSHAILHFGEFACSGS
jgi:hypothetical protein